MRANGYEEGCVRGDDLDGILWTLTDNLGSVRQVVEFSGGSTTITETLDYDAFGNATTPPSSSLLFRFTGRYFDDVTGLQYNWHRWYDPAAGRWISQDPIGFDGGDVNLSRYVGNSPTNATDPRGESPNQANTIDLSDLIQAIDAIEREFPNETPSQHLGRLRDALKGPTFPDGTKIPTRIRDPLRGPGNGDGWAYICTEKDGYIDLPHFMEAADRAAGGLPPFIVKLGGKGVEGWQGFAGTFLYPDQRGLRSSANTPEDIPSNNLGADFGGSFNKNLPLLTQCLDFFLPRGPLPRELSPGFDRLPKNEDDWEDIFRNDPVRAQEIIDLLLRAQRQPLEAPKP